MAKTQIMRRYVLTVVDYGDTCDGKARVMGVFKTHQKAYEIMSADAKDKAEEIYEDEEDAKNGTTITNWGASVGDTAVCGYEYKIEEVDIEYENGEGWVK